jgi:hypothetical protein
MNFVLRKGRSVRQGLSDVLRVEVWQFLDDLGRGHAVRNEVDDVGDRDPKAPDRCTPCKHGRISCDAIERLSHSVALQQS